MNVEEAIRLYGAAYMSETIHRILYLSISIISGIKRIQSENIRYQINLKDFYSMKLDNSTRSERISCISETNY
jgi:hypothetical protein